MDNPDISPMPKRHAFRASWHDYNDGLYFITICTHNNRHYFGRIVDGEMQLSAIGEIVDDAIRSIERVCHDARLANYVVMPNHVHLIIDIEESGCYDTPISKGCLKPRQHEPQNTKPYHFNSRLSVIIGQMKGHVTRQTRSRGLELAWQSRYHEHIIRNQQGFENISRYIDANPSTWDSDCHFCL